MRGVVRPRVLGGQPSCWKRAAQRGLAFQNAEHFLGVQSFTFFEFQRAECTNNEIVTLAVDDPI